MRFFALKISQRKLPSILLRLFRLYFFACMALSWAIVLALVAIPLYLTAKDTRCQYTWQQYLDKAHQKGKKLALDEFLPRAVPDAENFAAEPLFAACFERKANFAADRKEPLQLPSFPAKTSIRSDPVSGKRLDLEALKRAFIAAGWLPQDDSRPAAEAVLLALDSHFAADWAHICTAAARPKCRFPVDWQKGTQAALPHLGLMRQSSLILAIRLEADASLGNAIAAQRDFRMGLRFYEVMAKEPGVLNGYGRNDNLSTVLTAFWSSLSTHVWSSEQLAQIDDELSQLHVLADARFTFDSERAAINLIYNDLRSDNIARYYDPRDSDRFDGEKKALHLLSFSCLAGFMSHNQEWMNRAYDEELTRLDAKHGRWRIGPRTYDSEAIRNGSTLDRCALLLAVFNAPTDIDERDPVCLHTRLQEARIACALERFHLDAGEYPATLEALEPRYIRAAPHDAVNGEPFHYQRTSNGRYQLYAVGTNGVDDHGLVVKMKSFKGQPDWVWLAPE